MSGGFYLILLSILHVIVLLWKVTTVTVTMNLKKFFQFKVFPLQIFIKGAVHLACGYYRPGRFATLFDRFGSNLDQSDLRANYEWLWSQILKMLGRLATNLALIWPIWPNIAKSVVLKVDTWNLHWTDIFQSYERFLSQIWKKLSCLALIWLNIVIILIYRMTIVWYHILLVLSCCDTKKPFNQRVHLANVAKYSQIYILDRD